MIEIRISPQWNVDEITTWMIDNDVKYAILYPSAGCNYYRIEFKDEEDATVFKLRWNV